MTMDLAGRELKFSVSPISTYATGHAVCSLGDTVIMANASVGTEVREGTDFFPLTVDYEENMYAAGKIKGSRFIKREGRPSENSILVSRVIDRPIRPMFNKHSRNEIQLICTALSADMEVDPSTTAVNAASMALVLSGAPFEGPIGAVRVGYLNDKLIINPTYKECAEGKLNLVVAGTIDAITMVEAAANEVPEKIILEAFQLAHDWIKKICQFQLDFAKQFDIKPVEMIIQEPREEVVKAVADFVTDKMLDGIKGVTKMGVKERLHEVEDALLEKYAKEIEEEKFTKAELKEELNSKLEKRMRKNILEKEIRIDGRKLDEIRPLNIIPDVLPRTHGSCIFQRGETTALSITTLGGPGDAQIIDTMDSDETKRYMHHYHFPPYATGDIKMLKGPNRREIGHGDLAERALIPMLPDQKDFPYTIWVVSEILRCNGSSSMASVCGSTCSLMCAGVPLKKPVAGIAMGLVSTEDGQKYKILTDIQGMEDFAGDMDFKSAGTKDGITALQMDIKVKGLKMELLETALERAKNARIKIIDKILEVIPKPKAALSKYAPSILDLKIDPAMIRIVIGKGGETIQKITEEFGVEVDIEDEGLVIVTAKDQASGAKAIEFIKNLTRIPEPGEIYEGKVTRIMDFGAFVEILPGKEGLVHISELDNKRTNKVEDVVKLGDMVRVKLLEIDSQGRLNLSRRALLGPAPAGAGKSAPYAGKPDQHSAHTASSHVPKTVVTKDPKEEPGYSEKKDDKQPGEHVKGTHSVRKV